MQIRLDTSTSTIYGCPEQLVPEMLKLFTYTNKSVSFQYYKHTKGKRRYVTGVMRNHHVDEQEAAQMYYEEVTRLKRNMKKCLVNINTNGSLSFPTGLWNKMREFLIAHVPNYNEKFVVDIRNKPTKAIPFVANGEVKLYPFQQKALNACLQKGQGTIWAGTGTGKTLIIQELIRDLGLKVIIVVPTKSILHQTYERFTKYFGRNKVGVLGGGKTKRIRPIMVTCAPSLIKTTNEDWKDYDVLIIDEAHHTPCTTIEKICYEIMPHVYYRFGFTATNYRADGADLAIEAAVFPTVFKYSLEDGINEGYLAKPLFAMFNIERTNSSYGGKEALYAYKNHIMKNRFLNQLVIKQIKQFLSQGKQVLVLVKEKEHGNALQEAIPEAVFVRNKETKPTGYVAPYIKPERAIKDFNERKIRCLIGSSIIGEGTDILPVDVLFLLTGGSSKVSIMQAIGRGLRRCEGKDSVTIIDYYFNNHDLLSKHSAKRHSYYKKIGKVHFFDVEEDGSTIHLKTS